MKIKLGKIFLIVVLVPIFLFLFTKEVNAGCQFFSSKPFDECPGYPTICNWVEVWGIAQCWKCDGAWQSYYECDNCGQCGGGGGLPDQYDPQCGVEIQPSVGSVIWGPWGASSGCINGWNTTLTVSGIQKGHIYQIEGDAVWGSYTPYLRVDTDRGIKPWLFGHWTRTYVATRDDGTMQLTLGFDEPEEWGCPDGESSISNVVVKDITGAVSASSYNVNLRVGIWDDLGMGWVKIQNSDGSWPDPWTSFTYNESGQTLSATLPSSGTINVKVIDYAEKEGSCSDTIAVNQPPTCSSLTVPSSIEQGESVTVSAGASDDKGVSEVQFWYTTNKGDSFNYCSLYPGTNPATSWVNIGNDTNGSPWQYNWNTSGVAPDDYIVMANVIDNDRAQCTGNPSGDCGYDTDWCPNCKNTTEVVIACPTVPSIWLESGPEACDEIRVNWRDVANNDSYILQRRYKPPGGSWGSWTEINRPGANDTSYTDTNAKSCGTYQYHLRAVKSGCGVEWSDPESIDQIINAPSDANATPSGFNIDLRWTDNSGIEDGFRIERRTKTGGSWTSWGYRTTVGANSTFWTDTSQVCGGANPPSQVEYRVRAQRNSASCLNCYSTYVSDVADCCPAVPVISLWSPYPEGDDEIRVSWTDVANNDSYILQRRYLPPGGSWSSWTEIATPVANASFYTDWNAKSCGDYQYRLRAVKSGCPVVQWSNNPSISQVINAPSNPNAVPSGFNVYFTWRDNSRIEDGFRIERRTKSWGGSWTSWGYRTTGGASNPRTRTGDTLHWTDTSGVCGGANPPERVEYRVRAQRNSASCLNCYSTYVSDDMPCPVPSCEVILSPDPLPLIIGGDSVILSANFHTIESGTLEEINFVFDPNKVTVAPDPIDVSTPNPMVWQGSEAWAGTTFLGTTTITVQGFMAPGPGDVPRCEDTISVDVQAPPAWLQTQEGDVHAKGSIRSEIPEGATNPYFCLKGDGGTPGVVSHETALGSDPWGSGEVSETGWLANTNFSGKGYNYFYELLGSPTENWISGRIVDFPEDPGTGETEIIYTTKPAHVPGFTNLSGRKIIVLTSGNAIIENNITVATDGFLAVIAAGQINIDDGVSDVQGIYITDGHISTGGGSLAFTGEGMFVANSFESDRDLGAANQTDPVERFEYRADLWLNAPPEIMMASYAWQELAP